MQIGLFYRLGIREGGDSGRYYGAAEAIINGRLPAGKALSYLGYDLFVALIFAPGFEREAVIGAQVILSGIAAICLYRLAGSLYGAGAAFVATLWFTLFPDIQAWNYYVLTESLFISMIIISSYSLLSARSTTGFAVALLLAAFACTVRPHGLAYALGVGAYLLCRLRHAGATRTLAAVVVVLLLLVPVAWFTVGAMISHEEILDHYQAGTVIWGYDGFRLTAPEQLPAAIATVSNPLAKMILYASAHPGYMLELAGWKLYYFFSHIRPYYSLPHNIYSLLFLIPAYFFALFGLLSKAAARPCTRTLFAVTIMMQALTVAMTFADWDARHLVPVLPFVVILGAGGLVYIIERLRTTPGGTHPAKERI